MRSVTYLASTIPAPVTSCMAFAVKCHRGMEYAFIAIDAASVSVPVIIVAAGINSRRDPQCRDANSRNCNVSARQHRPEFAALVQADLLFEYPKP